MIPFQEFTTLAWNVRGPIHRATQRHIADLARMFQPSVLVILEPRGPFDRLRNFFTRLNYAIVHIIECAGRAGGIWVLHRLGCLFAVSLVSFCSRSVTFSVSRAGGIWHITAIYGSPCPQGRRADWNDLRRVHSAMSGPWLAIGDWNEILSRDETCGTIFHAARSDEFQAVLSDCGLETVHTVGDAFTWQRNTTGGPLVRKRLDRAVANAEWITACPEGFVETLTRRG